MSEENRALIQRFVEGAFNEGNLDVAEEVYASGYISHETAGPVGRGPGWITVDRVSDGRIEEEWDSFDQLGVMRQLRQLGVVQEQ